MSWENGPLYLCDQRRLRSAYAFARSDQKLHWSQEESFGPRLSKQRKTKTDRTVQMRRHIWTFAHHVCSKGCFAATQLTCICRSVSSLLDFSRMVNQAIFMNEISFMIRSIFVGLQCSLQYKRELAFLFLFHIFFLIIFTHVTKVYACFSLRNISWKMDHWTQG